MCVIIAVGENGKRPTDLQVVKCYQRNAEGAGIAWVEDAADGSGKEVVWKKALDRDQILELVRTVPQPFIAHFRIASVGGVHPELTHPFEIGPDAVNDIEGRTKLGVLFHNGTWGRWEDMVLTSAVKFGFQLPTHKWNDSRAIAYLGWIYGPGLFEILQEQKIAVLTAAGGLEVYHAEKWKNLDGILFSNDAWVNEYVPGFSPAYTPVNRHQQHQHQGPVGTGNSFTNDQRQPCGFGNCKNTAIYQRKYCIDHREFEGAGDVRFTHLTPKGDTQAATANERSPFEQRLHRMVRKSPDLVYQVAEKAYESGDGRLSKNAWKRVQKAVDEARYFNLQMEEEAAKSRGPLLLN